MRFKSALAAALVLAVAALARAPAAAQDFSITNPVAEPANPARRDIMRQLQAWWEMHAYYPRRASLNDEGGTVRLHLLIHADGNIWKIDVAGGAGSSALETAAAAAFRGGFVRPLPPGAADTELDLAVHYVLAHRHDEAVPAGYTPTVSRNNFTISNDPVTSPILDTMLQRTCTGSVVKQGIRNHPNYGTTFWAQAVFFRKPDGTPWVKFYEGGFPTLAAVTEVGKIVQWTGRGERGGGGVMRFTQYTVWPEGENNLSGNLEIIYAAEAKANLDINNGGTVDLACETERVPAITWSAMAVTPGPAPRGDPP